MKASSRLSEAVKRLLVNSGHPGKPMTIREAEDRSNVSYSVISGMAAGRVPGADHIIKFAAAFEQDVVEWLMFCDYDEIAKIIEAERVEGTNGKLEAMLDIVPLDKRERAREAARMAIQAVIFPLLDKTAA